MSSTAPYDPPPSRPASRASRSTRISGPTSNPATAASPPPTPWEDRIHSGLIATEHFAEKVEYIAGQVEKAARVGRRIEDVWEDEYGKGGGGIESGMSGGAVGGGRGYGGETTSEGEETEQGAGKAGKTGVAGGSTPPAVVPYQTASTTRQRKKPAASPNPVDAFQDDLDTTQEAVDDLFDSLEAITTIRHRLTGVSYNLKKLVKVPSSSSAPPTTRSSKLEAKESTKLAARVTDARKGLMDQYHNICALSPRFNAVLAASPSSFSKRNRTKLQREFNTLNSSFAKLLDFVEDRAKEEDRDVRSGGCDARLKERMEDEHPDWDEGKIVRELKAAKQGAKTASLANVNLPEYTRRWALENPFTELDRVLSEIDMNENGVSFSKKMDEKKGPWALATLLQKAMHPKKPKSKSPSRIRRKKPTRGYFEVGKSSSLSRDHDAASDVSTDTDEWDDVDKQQAGLLPSKEGGDGIDLADLPYSVPTDDTSGFQETPEELMQDQKDQRATEHLYTPILVAMWTGICGLVIYWGVARALGYQNPLGNVDLGSHLGNTAWNDTHDGLNTSSASSTSLISSTPVPMTTLDGSENASSAVSTVKGSTSALEAVLTGSVAATERERRWATASPAAAPAVSAQPTLWWR
ncbi:hypothetical protein JCM1840_001592 [Sporobolomyces johnsonii]